MVDTSETLLDRLKIEDAHGAWREFYERYWGVIVRYACKLGLNRTQADDVLQESMVALMRQLPAFVYDRQKGRFRNFLLTIVHRKALGVMQRNRNNPVWACGSADDAQAAGTNGTSHLPPLRDSIESWQEALLEEALSRLRDDSKLEEHTFAIFEAIVMHQRPIEEVAVEYCMKPNAIYQIKNRMLKRLRNEVNWLMRNSGFVDGDFNES